MIRHDDVPWAWLAAATAVLVVVALLVVLAVTFATGGR